MRHYPGLNFAAFERAARIGRAAGYVVVSPKDMDAEIGITAEAWTDSDEQIIESFDRDIAAIRGADGIALLRGWERSTGATAELLNARWLKKRVLNAETWKPFTLRDLLRINWFVLVWNLIRFLRSVR